MTGSRSLITVVIPAFNTERWIAETLASVVRQTYFHDRLEIVVVDDGSSDATAERALAELNRCDIAHTVLRIPESSGPSAARNRGWRLGRGEWIQFLDADDLLEPTKVELQAAEAISVSNDVAALYSSWGRLTMVDQTPQRVPFEPRMGEDQLLDVLRAESFLQVGCMLFSREWLEKTGGFNESYRLIEDVDLYMRVIMAGGRFQHVPAATPVCWYRQRAESLSHQDDEGFIEACLRNARCAERYWRERSELTQSRAAVLAGIYFQGTRFYAEHDRSMFESLAADIHRLEPRFLPPYPASLRCLARVIGYSCAERSTVHYRRLKRVLRSAATA